MVKVFSANDPCASNDVDFMSVTQACAKKSTSAPEASSTQNETTTTTSDSALAVEEEVGSFYSCSSTGNSSSDGNDVIGFPAVPPDTTELILMFEYELHTPSPLNGDVLASFENRIAHDLASQFGLINCAGEPKQLLRRTLQQVEVLALGSSPSDENLADDYECEELVDGGLGASTSCTPIRGYMTAYLPDFSSAENVASADAKILTLIENGMQSNLYVNDDVVKASFVGIQNKDGLQHTSNDRVDNADSDNDRHGSSGDIGNSNANENVNPTAGSPRLDEAKGSKKPDPSNNGNANENTNPTAGSPNLHEAKSAEKPESSDLPLLAIGISIFVLAFALAIFLAVYLRRKRRSKYFSDGPGGMGNGPNSLAAQAVLKEMPQDPDNVQLLPFTDQLDMRSVYSDEILSDVETENYTYDSYGQKKSFHRDHRGDSVNNHCEPSGTSRESPGSALAAMGVASTLAARSFTRTPLALEEYLSSSPSPTTPANNPNDHYSTPQPRSELTPGATTVDSHVGTVEEEEEDLLSEASISVSSSYASAQAEEGKEGSGPMGEEKEERTTPQVQKNTLDSLSVGSLSEDVSTLSLDEKMAKWVYENEL